MFESDFFALNEASLASWRRLMRDTMAALEAALPKGAYAGGDAAALAGLDDDPALPDLPRPAEETLAALKRIVARSVAVWSPRTAAHLHCPVLLPALAAELVIAALNQSMDSFDQAPSATLIELKMVDWLCRRIGLPAQSAATFTSGGTQSNFMGLLLARDAFSLRYWGHATREKGLHPDFAKLRILCSRHAHFSVAKSAIQLGLPQSAVVCVETDSRWRMDGAALAETVRRLKSEGAIPFAVVATAGTTDFGSIDPLAEIAGIARESGLWLHVDAAFGGALLMSPRHRYRLAGLELADSVTIDFHKAFFQPVSCSALALADRAHFDLVNVPADYLNPEDHAEEGFPDLVNWSLQTTRRFDALKLWMSFRALGASGFAQLIDGLVARAETLADRLACDPRFELLHRPDFACLVFRLVSGRGDDIDQWLNDAVPKILFRRGEAVIGHTRIGGRACLKLTMINPLAEDADMASLLDLVANTAASLLESSPLDRDAILARV